MDGFSLFGSCGAGISTGGTEVPAARSTLLLRPKVWDIPQIMNDII
jgi:hypothetical protein